MIDRDHDLPIIKQAKALGISRGSVSYRPRPVSAAALAVMRRTDELHLEFPFAGSRMLRDLLNKEGVEIGRHRVATLMKRMGIEALYRKPNTSKPAPGHSLAAQAAFRSVRNSRFLHEGSDVGGTATYSMQKSGANVRCFLKPDAWNEIGRSVPTNAARAQPGRRRFKGLAAAETRAWNGRHDIRSMPCGGGIGCGKRHSRGAARVRSCPRRPAHG